ncbi:MAG: hypothetical protein A2156_06395 [Deltaproteobacteria bacterium RBG_16_48_10]|nr:MAG: hypothetical protein A2156_06395 [Deltaproteobacteria bacterium RBG_16_48_10]
MVKSLKLVLLLLLFALLLSGCSHVVYPRGAIPVKMDVVGSMDAKKVVSFINGVTDSKLNLVATKGSDKYFADYKHWTSSIVSQLEEELRNRGVQVKPESEVGFKVGVESVGLFWGAFATRCIVRVRVEKIDGTWSRTYEGNNASNHFNRAIDGAAYKAVVAIMGDQDFKNAMR